ncbi:MAG: hypothetical protein KGL39_25445 [Patescibacteria group bacterium]|nr:hypothetical protein [Patescibacteria group bacterium]
MEEIEEDEARVASSELVEEYLQRQSALWGELVSTYTAQGVLFGVFKS